MLRIGAILILLSTLANQTQSARSEHEHADKTSPINSSEAQKSEDGTQTVISQQTIYSGKSEADGESQAAKAADPPHDWIDRLNAFSTFVIALFTILLFVGVIWQVRTSREIERAWVMTELRWNERALHVVNSRSTKRGEEVVESTQAYVKLICKNAGKSPGWIDHIFGHMEITAGAITDGPPDGKLHSFGRLGPIGPDDERSCTVDLQCIGHHKEEGFLSIYIVVEYRDIFGKKRTTSLGYVVHGGELFRQDGLPKRQNST